MILQISKNDITGMFFQMSYDSVSRVSVTIAIKVKMASFTEIFESLSVLQGSFLVFNTQIPFFETLYHH